MIGGNVVYVENEKRKLFIQNANTFENIFVHY